MPTRLLAVDMDGTLLTSERAPHPDSVAAIHRAIAHGITVVLASGRIRTSMIPFAEDMHLQGPMISCNGAYIEDADRNEIASWLLPTEVVDIVHAYVVESGVHLNVYSPTELVYLQDSPFGFEYARRSTMAKARLAPIEEIRRMRISKILVMDHPECIPIHRRILEERIDPSLSQATVSEPDYLEFLPSGVSKGKALKVLCDTLGIAQNESAAIGDYLNDKEMLEWAGVSAVVKNGHELLRSVAQYVVRSNDEGGVAEFIDHLVLENRVVPV